VETVLDRLVSRNLFPSRRGLRAPDGADESENLQPVRESGSSTCRPAGLPLDLQAFCSNKGSRTSRTAPRRAFRLSPLSPIQASRRRRRRDFARSRCGAGGSSSRRRVADVELRAALVVAVDLCVFSSMRLWRGGGLLGPSPAVQLPTVCEPHVRRFASPRGSAPDAVLGRCRADHRRVAGGRGSKKADAVVTPTRSPALRTDMCPAAEELAPYFLMNSSMAGPPPAGLVQSSLSDGAPQ
jgi:hypothetical protein